MVRRLIPCLLFNLCLVSVLAGAAAATPGQLDPTFGAAGTGLVRTDITPSSDTAYASVIQPDGKIVVVGGVGGSGGRANSRFAVARYNADGALDTSFHGDGIAQTDLGPHLDAAFSAAVQPDGKIVVAGVAGGGSPDAKYAVVRYGPHGYLDQSFGVGGIVRVDVTKHFDMATGVGLLDDGTIVVAGSAGGEGSHLAVVALNGTNGSLHKAFGGTGIVRLKIGINYDLAESNVLVHDDEVYFAGTAVSDDEVDGFIVSYNADGTLNTSFGGGIVTMLPPAGGVFDIYGLIVDGAGNILAAGDAQNEDVPTDTTEPLLARLTPSGALDATFNPSGVEPGIVLTNFGASGGQASGVALDASGDILTTGVDGVGSNPTFAVCRYLPTGSLDPSFGTGGEVFTDFGPFADEARSIDIQSNGRIVAVGSVGGGSGDSKFALAGYEGS